MCKGVSVALRTCIKCGAICEGSRCEACSVPRTYSEKGRSRPNSHVRGYDRAWRALSAYVLVRDKHICRLRIQGVCSGKATTGDHITPLSRGGARLDPANVQAACRPCNSAKRDHVLAE